MSVAIAITPAPSRGSIIAADDSLIKLCQHKLWHVVAEHVRANPSVVKAASAAVDNKAMTPLHIACENGAPIQIIKLLLTAHPPAAQIVGGHHERLPLHCLLASYIITNNNTTPSESIVAALIEAYPGACRAVDKYGNLPIHLACQAAHISDAIFTSILSMNPEGAYARNLSGQYPLHIAAANKDVPTKKVALAALDRGTLYASISKMTSIRLSMEHEDRTRLLEKKHADKVAKMEAHAIEERTKLKAQIESLMMQLKNEKDINSKLQIDRKNLELKHIEDISLAVQNERTKASDMEKQLRSELAEVQLKNMDFLDQIELLQEDLCTSNEKVKDLAKNIEDLEHKNENSNNLLAETTANLESTRNELSNTQDQLVTCVIELKRLNSVMALQKETLAGFLMGQDTIMNDTGALVEKMVVFADDIEHRIKNEVVEASDKGED